MKIVSVDVIKCKGEWYVVKTTPWNPICIRINTDEGISGYGEIGLVYGDVEQASFGMLQDYGRLLIGQDPTKIEFIWENLFRKTFWAMGGGSLTFGAISAIDIALWDIKGKALGVPVYELLGGKTNDGLRTYASQVQFDWGKKSRALIHPEEYADATRSAIADGYDCVKVDPVAYDEEGVWMGWSNYGLLKNHQLEVAVRRMQAMREAAGPHVDIIVEMHSLTDTNTAVQFAREIESLRCFYYEEPVMPLNPTSMSVIRQKVNLPLASGERIYSRWGFRQFFEDRSLQVIQPDLGNCGGLTEGKKICDMGHVYDCAVQIHICGGPLATAAALQLEAVIPNFLIHEHHAAALLDGNIEMCRYDLQPTNGKFTVPDRPGIGQELSEKGLAQAQIVTIR